MIGAGVITTRAGTAFGAGSGAGTLQNLANAVLQTRAPREGAEDCGQDPC